MTIERGIFDLDDTLMPTHHALYTLPKLAFLEHTVKTLGQTSPDLDALLKRLEETDQKLEKTHGFSKKRFPNAMAFTLHELAGELNIPITREDCEYARAIGERVFDRRVYRLNGLLPGAEKTLNFLVKEGIDLQLVTMGDEEVQNAKVEELGLKKWFGNKIHIVPGKKTDKLSQLATEDKGKTFYVGNSYKSDMLASLEAGIRGIYVPCEIWYRDRANPLKIDPTITKLAKISDLIELYPKL